MTSSLLLAAVATVLIGTADFWGALGSRHGRPLAVAGWSQVLGIPMVGVAVLLVAGDLLAIDAVWGALAGVAIGLGLLSLYVGFAGSVIGVVAPVSAVVTVGVPVAFGLASGERPSAIALAGIGSGVLAVALVSGGGDRSAASPARGVLLGLGAGIGFGLGLALLGNTSEDSGLWPLLATRFTAGGSILLGGVSARRPLLPNRRSWGVAAMAALFGAVGMSFFVVAAQQGPLTLVAVVTAMFPAVTVALAAIVLGDRLRRLQMIGVALALAAVAMISIG
jgi:drug/metabolite transporter (DMT)-like permease